MTNNNKTLHLWGRLCVALLCFIVGATNASAQSTKTEGFEKMTAGSNYQGTVTISTSESDCGVSWEMFYGTVSTSSKITGNKSAALRLYTSANYGYLKTTTAIDGLSKVTLKAKAATSNSANILVNVSYSTDGSTWTAIETDKALTATAASYEFDIPSGGKYFQIAISSNSKKPSTKNAQLTIDDVEFTYSSDATVDPVFTGWPTDNMKIGETATISSSNTSTSFTLAASPSGVVSISGGTITAVGAGTATITATQAAATGYNAISNVEVGTITVDANANPTITPNTAQSLATGATLTVTSDSPGALTVTSSDPSVASVSGETITALAEGTTTISVTQAAATGYNAVTTPVTFTLTVTAAASSATATGNLNNSNTGVFAGITGGTSGTNWTPSGSGTVTGSISTSAGNVSVVYDKGGSTNMYLSDAQIRMYSAGSTLTFTAPTGYVLTNITITLASSGGGAFTSLTTDVNAWNTDTGKWTGSSNSVTFTGQTANTRLVSAEVTIQAEGSSSGNETASVTFTDANKSLTVGDTYTNTATKDPSALVVTYESNNTSVATIDANTGLVTAVAAGTATITCSWAEQDVDGTTYDAGSATYTVTVSAAATDDDITEDSEKIVYSFASNDNWGFPTSSTTGTNTYTGASTTTTSDSYKTITLSSTTTGYRKYNTGIIIGKVSGAYVQLPTFSFDVASIEVVGLSGASTSVTQNIYVGDDAVSTQCTGSTGTNSYEIAEGYQAAGNVYKVQATNANNMQIAQIIVYKKTSSTVTKPVASPVGGTYETAQTVTLTSETNEIYYTTDGTDPKLSSTHATSPVNVAVNNGLTLRYIAYNGTEWSSEGIEQTYVIKPATPTLSPASGTFSSATSVIANCSTSGVTLYYTTDGTDPTSSSATTTGSIAVSETCTIKVIAIDANGNQSDVASGTYTITSSALGTTEYQLVTDASQIAEGNSYILVGYKNSTYVAMSSTASGNYYGGVEVTVGSKICDIDGASSVAVVQLEDLGDSKWAIKLPDGNYLSAGSSDGANLVSDNGTSNNVNQWTITADGTNGYVATSVAYTARSISVNYASGWRIGNYSNHSSGNQPYAYLYVNATGVAAPIITPSTGTYTEAQTVSISGPEGATIYYTTDGTDPTDASTVYTGSFSVSKTTIVKAIAYKDGSHSSITTSTLTFYVQPPVFSQADGSTFNEEYTVDITSPQGYTIYYRLNDDKIYNNEFGYPTATQTTEICDKAVAYSGTLTLAQSITISAVCVDPAGNISAPTVVNYSYTGAVKPNYHDAFSANAGSFTVTTEDNTYTNSNGAPQWRLNSNTGADAIAQWGEERYYEYVTGSNNTYASTINRYYGLAHFTSPVIDLTDASLSDPYFNFIHAGHGFYSDPNTSGTTDATAEQTLDDNVAATACRVYIGEADASGNVTTWTQVDPSKFNMFHQTFNSKAGGPGTTTTTSTTSRGGEFNRMNSGNIDLSDYLGKNIRIRFTYESTPQAHGTWNIDEFNVYASAAEKFTMNIYGWSTYVLDHDIDMYQTTKNYTDAGKTLKVYKVPEFDQNTVVLQQLGMVENHVEGTDNSERYVLAGTPIVIQGPAGEEINFVLSEYTGIIKPVADNLLKGSLEPNTVKQSGDARLFILTIHSGMTEPFFNKISNGREIPDHRAYLDGINEVEQITLTADETNGRYLIGQNGNTTGIETIDTKTTENTGKWYTLQGLEVAQPTKGIYIHNGRKVIIK